MRRLAILALAGAIGACAAPVERGTCPAGLSAQQVARLYFGLTSVAGAPIPDADWADFVAREITPRFPDGLTAYASTGQWRDRDSGRVVLQPSRVIEVIAQADPATLDRLQAIRSAYRRRFHQQSVGLGLAPLCASF